MWTPFPDLINLEKCSKQKCRELNRRAHLANEKITFSAYIRNKHVGMCIEYVVRVWCPWSMVEISARRFAANYVRYPQEWSLRQSDGQSMAPPDHTKGGETSSSDLNHRPRLSSPDNKILQNADQESPSQFITWFVLLSAAKLNYFILLQI